MRESERQLKGMVEEDHVQCKHIVESSTLSGLNTPLAHARAIPWLASHSVLSDRPGFEMVPPSMIVVSADSPLSPSSALFGDEGLLRHKIMNSEGLRLFC